MEMLVQLSIKTSMQFSSPTGIIGNYNHGRSCRQRHSFVLTVLTSVHLVLFIICVESL